MLRLICILLIYGVLGVDWVDTRSKGHREIEDAVRSSSHQSLTGRFTWENALSALNFVRGTPSQSKSSHLMHHNLDSADELVERDNTSNEKNKGMVSAVAQSLRGNNKAEHMSELHTSAILLVDKDVNPSDLHDPVDIGNVPRGAISHAALAASAATEALSTVEALVTKKEASRSPVSSRHRDEAVALSASLHHESDHQLAQPAVVTRLGEQAQGQAVASTSISTRDKSPAFEGFERTDPDGAPPVASDSRASSIPSSAPTARPTSYPTSVPTTLPTPEGSGGVEWWYVVQVDCIFWRKNMARQTTAMYRATSNGERDRPPKNASSLRTDSSPNLNPRWTP